MKLPLSYVLHVQHLKARVLKSFLNLKVSAGSVAKSLRRLDLGKVNAID